MNNALIPLMRDGYMCNEVLGQPWQMKLKYLNTVLWYYFGSYNFLYLQWAASIIVIILTALQDEIVQVNVTAISQGGDPSRRAGPGQRGRKVSLLACFKHEKNDTINITSILNGRNCLVTHLQPLKNYPFVPAEGRSALRKVLMDSLHQ